MLDDYAIDDATAKLDAIIDRKLEQIDQVRQSQFDQLNDVVAQKLGQLDGAAVETGANPAVLPTARGKPPRIQGFRRCRGAVPWRATRRRAKASSPQRWMR